MDARACFGAPDGRRAGLTVRAANSGGLQGHAIVPGRAQWRGVKKLEYTSLTEPTSFNDAIEQLLQS
jgi:hypothetical protein